MNNYINSIAKINKKQRYQFIIDILEENGVDYQLQDFQMYGVSGRNIIVESKDKTNPKIVISAHYDNVPGTPGAVDNAAACSILLNLINRYKNFETNFEFVFFDLEELGFLGSNFYLNNTKEKIEFAINLDMIGSQDENIVVQKQDLINDRLDFIFDKYELTYVNCLPPGDAYSFFRKHIPTLYIVNSSTKDLDFYKSYRGGMCDISNTDFGKTMHKSIDVPENVNLMSVEKTLCFVNEIIRTLNEKAKYVFVPSNHYLHIISERREIYYPNATIVDLKKDYLLNDLQLINKENNTIEIFDISTFDNMNNNPVFICHNHVDEFEYYSNDVDFKHNNKNK